MLKKVLAPFELTSAIIALTSASTIAAPANPWRPEPDINPLEMTNQPIQSSKNTSDRAALPSILIVSASPVSTSTITQALLSGSHSTHMASAQPARLVRPNTIAPKIAQTVEPPVNDFGLPPAPPIIDLDLSRPPSPAPALPAVEPRYPVSNPGTLPAPAGSSLLFPDAPTAPRSAPRPRGLQLPEVNPSLAIPTSFPPIEAPSNLPVRRPTVTVPQLDRSGDRPTVVQPKPTPRSTSTEDTPVPARSRTIQFGQPLPSE